MTETEFLLCVLGAGVLILAALAWDHRSKETEDRQCWEEWREKNNQ